MMLISSRRSCGGTSLLQLYKRSNAPSSSATTNSIGTDAVSTSSVDTTRVDVVSSVSSASSSPATVSIVQTQNAYNNRGLYNDNDPTLAFILSGNSITQPSMSVNVCSLYCSAYAYFGVENGKLIIKQTDSLALTIYTGDTCYCGDTLNYQSAAAADQSGGLDIPCAGKSAKSAKSLTSKTETTQRRSQSVLRGTQFAAALWTIRSVYCQHNNGFYVCAYDGAKLDVSRLVLKR